MNEQDQHEYQGERDDSELLRALRANRWTLSYIAVLLTIFVIWNVWRWLG